MCISFPDVPPWHSRVGPRTDHLARAVFWFLYANCRRIQIEDALAAGLDIDYKSEDGYVGPDGADIFMMFPYGSAAEWHYLILVR